MYLLIDTTQSRLFLSLMNPKTGELSKSALFSGSDNNASQVSQYFFSQLQALCEQAQIIPTEITGLAINTGPGSFTGIRVGLTVARMMAKFQPNIDSLFVFNTFELLAATQKYRNQPVCILLNAYRGRHYRAIICVTEHSEITYLEEPSIFANSESVILDNYPILIEPSLLPLLNLELNLDISDIGTAYVEAISQLDEAMAFLLQRELQSGVANHRVVFDNLLPNYMQLPHITVKKSKATQG